MPIHSHDAGLSRRAPGWCSLSLVARDTIELEGLGLDCVLGVYPDERDREQPVRVDLRMGLDLGTAGRSASIGDTVDYDRAANEIAALLRFRR
jgi:dihydroneopterin aldolase